MLETIVFYMAFAVVGLGVLIPIFGNPKNIKMIKFRFRLHSTAFLLFTFFVILQIIEGEQPIEYIVGFIIILIILLQSLIWTLFDIIKAYSKEEKEAAENNK